MKKISKLFLGLAALGLAACSNEEPAPNGGNSNVATGDVAYLNITIKSADDAAGSRAATGDITNGDNQKVEYIYGDQGENDVVSAHFYFYDEAGKFVLKADKWTNGTTGTTENVEVIGDNTVILENMTGKNYPTWMVTVLNQPDGFTPGATLDEMEKIIVDSWESGHEKGRFIMTTSSYFGNENKNGESWNYFATKLKPENFYQQTPDQETIPAADRVQVYVERLAVRVGVDMVDLKNEKLQNVTYNEEDAQGVMRNYPLYRVDASVGGEGNGNVGDAAATKLYVAITGWELTSTAKRTNFVKSLNGWNNTTTFGSTWLWNDGDKDNHNTGDNDGYHRSYWGKSTTYGLSGTALSNALNVQTTKWEKLNQIVGTEVFNGTRLYCNENTNEAANITDNGLATGTVDPSKTTTVMLRAVVCNEKGEPVQLVRYLGLNFVQDQFVIKALEKVSPVIYTRTDTGEKYADGTTKYTYNNITPDFLNVVSNAASQGTGAVKIVLSDEKAGEEYFILSGDNTYEHKYTDEEGEHTVTITKPNAISKTTDEVNAYLATATAGTNNKAIGYKDGASYYPICIEHLNQPATKGTILEGQYGVVRNHVYNIRISMIKTLGEGVFVPRSEDGDESEILIPSVKEPTYYVESNINILSWKVVSQQVEI